MLLRITPAIPSTRFWSTSMAVTNVSYGSINNAQTVIHAIPFAIPNVGCGSTQNITDKRFQCDRNASSSEPQLCPRFAAGRCREFRWCDRAKSARRMDNDPGFGHRYQLGDHCNRTGQGSELGFANDPATVNMSSLVSPAVSISSASAQLKFRNKYILNRHSTVRSSR